MKKAVVEGSNRERKEDVVAEITGKLSTKELHLIHIDRVCRNVLLPLKEVLSS